MYDLKRRKQFNTIGDLKELIKDISDDIKICICGNDNAWFHIEQDNSLVDLDNDNLNGDYFLSLTDILFDDFNYIIVCRDNEELQSLQRSIKGYKALFTDISHHYSCSFRPGKTVKNINHLNENPPQVTISKTQKYLDNNAVIIRMIKYEDLLLD